MATQIKSITELPVLEIVWGKRLRPVTQAGVDALIASIGELGVMKDPIHVRKVKHRDGELVLMAGGHRLVAARKLGWEMIPATVWDCTDDWALLMEIDDNIAGAELNALDTAVFLAERKIVYEKLHPETKAGVFKGNQHTEDVVTDTMSFTKATAAKFGMSVRNVERIVRAGTALDDNMISALRKAPKAVGMSDLQTLAKVGDVKDREAAVAGFVSGEHGGIAASLKALKPGAKPSREDETNTQHLALRSGWSKASKAARKRFVRDFAPEIQALLKEATS